MSLNIKPEQKKQGTKIRKPQSESMQAERQ